MSRDSYRNVFLCSDAARRGILHSQMLKDLDVLSSLSCQVLMCPADACSSSCILIH